MQIGHTDWLSVGRLHPDYHTTTPPPPTTTPATPTTSSGAETTTLDPCEHLLQELELEGVDQNKTFVDLSEFLLFLLTRIHLGYFLTVSRVKTHSQ